MKLNSDTHKPYATCKTCGVFLQTRAEVNNHIADTINKATTTCSSHLVNITNPTHKERLAEYIHATVDIHLESLFAQFAQMIIDSHLTEDDVNKNLSDIKVQQLWAQYVELQQPFEKLE